MGVPVAFWFPPSHTDFNVRMPIPNHISPFTTVPSPLSHPASSVLGSFLHFSPWDGSGVSTGFWDKRSSFKLSQERIRLEIS